MTKNDPLVLLVEDEPQVRRFLRNLLGAHGYGLVEAETAAAGHALASKHVPDLVLLDLGLPDGDGVDVTRRLRAWTQTPIIILSARDREGDKVEALDAGANDYLTKPFSANELLARMRVALRPAASVGGEGDPVYQSGALRVDLSLRQAFVDGAEVRLTPTEYKLLATLVRNAGKVVTHNQLLQAAWGPGHADQKQYLRVYMGQLRHKLEAEPARPRHLMTEPGVGYRLRI